MNPLDIGDTVTYAPLEGGGTWGFASSRGTVVDVTEERALVRWEDGVTLPYDPGVLVRAP